MSLAPAAPAVDVESGAKGVPGESIVVSTWTAVSRLTGLAKLGVVGAVLGATYIGNAFQAMNLLPTVAFEFLTGSLLINLLVPHLVKHIEAGRPDSMRRIANGFLGRACLVFVALTALLYAGIGPIVGLFTAGVSDPAVAAAQRTTSTFLLALMLPQIMLYGIAGVAGAVLNAKGRFGLVAAAPAFENVAIIAAVGTTGVIFRDRIGSASAPTDALLILGVGATVAVALHALVLWLACWRAGTLLVPRLARGNQEVGAIVAMAPSTLGQAGMNVMRAVVGVMVANAVAGGVLAFQFAMTFFYLPSALGAKAVGVPMLRRLATAFHRRDEQEFRARFSEGINLTAFLVVPAALLYLVLAGPIVRGVSFGGLDTPRGTLLVALALTALAPAVIAEASFLLGSYASYARHDPRSPMRSMIVRTVITVGWMVVAGALLDGNTLLLHLGIAVTVGNVAAAAHLLKTQSSWARLRSMVLPSLTRTALASAAMAAVAFPIATVLERPRSGPIEQLLIAIVAVGVGGLGYLTAHRLLGSPELEAIVSGVRSRHAVGGAEVQSLQTDRGQTVVIDPEGRVRKTYGGTDARRRAVDEFGRLERVSWRFEGETRIGCPRPLELHLDAAVVVMSRVEGERLDALLTSRTVPATEIDEIASRLAEALRIYVEVTGEPYHDFHLRNALYDPVAKRISIVDFDVPAHLDLDPRLDGDPIALSMGNLIGSTTFETARPTAFLRRRFRRQAVAVVRRVIDELDRSPSGTGSNELITSTAEIAYVRSADGGSPVRRLWYATAGAWTRNDLVSRLTKTQTLSPASIGSVSPSDERGRVRRIVIAASIAAVVLTPFIVLRPLATVAAVGGLALVAVIIAHPPLAAYMLLALTPLVVGLNRSSVLPIVRLNEVLVVLAAGALVLRYLIDRALDGHTTGFRIGRVERALALLLLTGSALPILWMIARNRTVTRDDFLYALVLWKLALTFFVIRASVRTPLHVRRCLWFSIGGVAVVAGIGIAQAVGIGEVSSFLARFYAPEGLTAIVTNNRATSTIGNAISFADVMAIHVAIVAGMLIRRDRRRTTLIVIACCFAVAALASGQLSGALALVIAGVTIAAVTRRGGAIVVAAIPIAIVAVFALRPVVEQRLEKIDPSTGMPQSWAARGENLTTYFLPEFGDPTQLAFGVRAAGRVPAHEGWRDWVYIESGYVWLLWTGGIPFVLAFLLYLRSAYRSTIRAARYRQDALGAASLGVVAALAIGLVLMALDPHLTMRGTADLTFALLGLATARMIGSEPAAQPRELRQVVNA